MKGWLKLIIGLIGSSCGGKSFYLEVLESKLNFYVPTGITTRSRRNKNNGLLEHIPKNSFLSLKKNNQLCFISESFNHYYAYRTIDSHRNVAIEISRNNINELKKMDGIVIKIIPGDLEAGLKLISEQRSQGKNERMANMIKEYYENNAIYDYVFPNYYNEKSVLNFLDLVKSIL